MLIIYHFIIIDSITNTISVAQFIVTATAVDERVLISVGIIDIDPAKMKEMESHDKYSRKSYIHTVFFVKLLESIQFLSEL